MFVRGQRTLLLSLLGVATLIVSCNILGPDLGSDRDRPDDSPQQVVVTGSILLDRSPLQGASVQIGRTLDNCDITGPPGEPCDAWWSGLAGTGTDSNGHYRLELEIPRTLCPTLSVHAGIEGITHAGSGVSCGSNVINFHVATVDIAATGVVRLDGAPVSDATVTMAYDTNDEWLPLASTTTGSDGAYALSARVLNSVCQRPFPVSARARVALGVDVAGLYFKPGLLQCGDNPGVDIEVESRPPSYDTSFTVTITVDGVPTAVERVELGYGDCASAVPGGPCPGWTHLFHFSTNADGTFVNWWSPLSESACAETLYLQVQIDGVFYRQAGVICDPPDQQVIDFSITTGSPRLLPDG